MTKKDFAQLCGVAPAAITYAVRRSLVVVDDDGGIDPAHPVNAAYLRRHAKGVRSQQPSQHGRDEDLETQRLRAEVRLKEEQAAYHAVRRLEKIGQLVERRMVEQFIAQISAEIQTKLLTLPRRLVSQVYALAKSGDEHEVEEYLSREIESSLRGIKQELESWLKAKSKRS